MYQDYIPNIPSIKMYLNLVYQTGLPSSRPKNVDPYLYKTRLRDYKRADLGISHIFASQHKKHPKGHWLHPFKELSISLEVINLFNNKNAITNSWVRDVKNNEIFAVPNFMTARVLNLKISTRF